MIFQRYFKIRKGGHYSIHGIGIQWPNSVLSYRFRLPESAWYSKSELDSTTGVNKIVGRSMGLNPSKDSIRVGWQPNFDNKGSIKLYLYIHDNGEKFQYPILDIKTEITYRVDIVCKDDAVSIYLDSKHVGTYDHTLTPGIGWKLYPYFGGDSKAPHDMLIYAHKI